MKEKGAFLFSLAVGARCVALTRALLFGHRLIVSPWINIQPACGWRETTVQAKRQTDGGNFFLCGSSSSSSFPLSPLFPYFFCLSLSVVVQPLPRRFINLRHQWGKLAHRSTERRTKNNDRLTLFACERVAQITDVSSHHGNVILNERKSITPHFFFVCFGDIIHFMQMLWNLWLTYQRGLE